MKPIYAVVVLLSFIAGACGTGIMNYRTARARVVLDMNQALAKTLQGKQEAWITQDTINTYRRNLTIDELRECSFVYYAMSGHNKQWLSSDKMKWDNATHKAVFQSYANCSVLSLWLMADKRAPLFFSVMAVLWSAWGLWYFKRRRARQVALGDLVFRESDESFFYKNGQEVKFTPMQHRLMVMFYSHQAHALSKQEICETLWPKKPDASDTLYTLIRRLRPIVEQSGRLKIVTDRENGYSLQETCNGLLSNILQFITRRSR